MNIDAIKNGIVIDHIKAGKAMDIYSLLKLDALECSVAIIKNARSKKMGVKDIIVLKCENPRCITSVERDIQHVFKLTDKENHVYRCVYCESRPKHGKSV